VYSPSGKYYLFLVQVPYVVAALPALVASSLSETESVHWIALADFLSERDQLTAVDQSSETFCLARFTGSIRMMLRSHPRINSFTAALSSRILSSEDFLAREMEGLSLAERHGLTFPSTFTVDSSVARAVATADSTALRNELMAYAEGDKKKISMLLKSMLASLERDSQLQLSDDQISAPSSPASSFHPSSSSSLPSTPYKSPNPPSVVSTPEKKSFPSIWDDV